MNTIIDISRLENPNHYQFETVPCYQCGAFADDQEFAIAQEDLTGKPGNFRFGQCQECGLVFQNPRLTFDQIGAFYDDQYIAHRNKKDWGIFSFLTQWGMDQHNKKKLEIINNYVQLGPQSHVLDGGCATGTFLNKIRKTYGSKVAGVDFKRFDGFPDFEHIDFYHGEFFNQDLPSNQYDLITLWHFLEHCYDPMKTLQSAKDALSKTGRIVIEVPRLDSLSYQLFQSRWPGFQAPQHTVIFDKAHLLQFVESAGLKVVDYLPYGAFPPYFYFFTGALFKILRGRGMNLKLWTGPYFLGQVLTSPFFLFQRRLNLSMQTVICEK